MDTTQPARSSRAINATPFFYGWIVLGIGSLGSLMMGPSQTFTVSLFISSFVTDLGLSQSAVSLIYGVSTLAASFMLPITGRAVDRFGPRRMMLLISIGLGLVTMSISLINGAVTLLLGMLLLRFFGFGSMQLVANNAVAQWFVQRRGLVMGLLNQSLSVSLVLFPWLAAVLIGWVGWRSSWVIMGIGVLVIMVPLSWLLVRDRPEIYGLTPDGHIRPKDESAEVDNSLQIAEVDWTLAEARGTRAFWVFIAAFATMTMIFSTLAFHQVSLFREQGLSQTVAVQSFQVVALVSVFSNILMGRLVDTASARLLMACALLILGGQLIYVQYLNSPLQAMLYGALTGIASGGYRVLDSAIWPKYFGRRHLGSIKGVTLIGTLGGSAFGPYPLGLSADLTGSFVPALNLMIVFPIVLAVVVYFGVTRPQKT
jgi:MFS family permease